MSDAEQLFERLMDEIDSVLVGNQEVLELLTVALISRGHVLLEGPPGVAKTTIANLFARALGLDYRRIQLTPDLLPADITGTHIYREPTGEFELYKGPIFANIVLADEINRAPPKTQSALLEAMQELQVTIEGDTLPLPDPFMLIATQNPIEMEGVFDLPEAQRDRFLFKLQVGLVDRQAELALLDRFDSNPSLGPTEIESVISSSDLNAAHEDASSVFVANDIKEYIFELATATREHEDIAYGASTRASIMLLQSAKARAALHGRSYVIPDDVKTVAAPLLRHRLVLTTEAELGDHDVDDLLPEVIDSIAPPGTEFEPEEAV